MFKLRWPPGLSRPAGQFLRSMPLRPKVLLYAGIFFCFAPMGLLQAAMNLRMDPAWAVAVSAAYAGAGAAFFAWIMFTHPRWFPVPIVLVFLGPIVFEQLLPP